MAAGLAAAGYHGPPALTVARAIESWAVDLPVLLGVLVVGGCYLAGVRRAHAGGQRWPAARTVAFLAGGTGTLVIATMSFLGVYGNVLFTVRAAQTILLLLVAPLFLALGRPLSLAITTSPRLGRRIEAVVASRTARVLTFPAITALVLVIVPFVLYFTPWYGASLRSDPVAELTRLALILPGLVFFWTLLRVDPVPKAYPYLVSLWVTGMEVVGDAVLGLAVIADQHLIAGPYYLALARPWGPGLRTDQVLGGGALWILGDLVGLPFLAAQLIQMIKEDEREAVRVDAELDAAQVAAGLDAAQVAAGLDAAQVAAGLDAAQVAAGLDAAQVAAGLDAAQVAPVVSGVTGEETARAVAADSDADSPGRAAHGERDVSVIGRPWWESDPRFTGRFRKPGSGRQ